MTSSHGLACSGLVFQFFIYFFIFYFLGLDGSVLGFSSPSIHSDLVLTNEYDNDSVFGVSFISQAYNLCYK